MRPVALVRIDKWNPMVDLSEWRQFQRNISGDVLNLNQPIVSKYLKIVFRRL
jgi:hypothetical protein